MDDDDSNRTGRERHAPDPQALADQMAQFGTPNWETLTQIAERLAAKYKLPDSISLAQSFAGGIAISHVEQENLALVKIDEQMVVINLNYRLALSYILPHVVELINLLPEARSNLEPESTSKLQEALEEFLPRHAFQDYVVTNVKDDGSGSRRPSPAHGFVRTLAPEWRRQTGRDATAYKDPKTKRLSGDFGFFAVEACQAVGFKPPSASSFEKWLNPDYPGVARSAWELLGSPQQVQQNAPEAGELKS